MNGKTVTSTRTELAQIMTPLEANVLGNVFGGAILSMIDLTASATAQKFSGNVSVTASFDRVDFHEPIEVGNLVTMMGTVSYAGRTSMEITIDVFATRLTEGIKKHTNTARVTMVALKDGRPTPVPALICETIEEKVMFLEGKLRRELRRQYLNELDQHYTILREYAESKLDELIAAPSLTAALGIHVTSLLG